VFACTILPKFEEMSFFSTEDALLWTGLCVN